MKSAVVLVALCLVCPGMLFGGEIIFKNGDRIQGKVTGLSDGKLTIEGDNLGSFKVDLDKVSTFSTDDPIVIWFKDGSRFNQKILASDPGRIVVEKGPALNPLQCNLADLDKINPPPVEWEGSVLGGFNINRGNTYTNNAHVAVEAVRRSEVDRITFKGGYTGARQKDDDTNEKETTQRQANASLKYDYFFTKKLYGYAKTEAERDAMADLELRFLGGAGSGYQFYETDTFKLAGEIGVSWISLDYEAPTENDNYFSGRVAYGLEKVLNDAVTFFHGTEWYPSLEDFSDDQLVKTMAGLRSKIVGTLFAEFKFLMDWDSSPADDKERTDVTYLFSLGWSF